MRWRERAARRKVRWELISCALSGHILVGTDAAEVRPEDEVVALAYDRPGASTALRWHRCLRCDSWFPRPVPKAPSRPFPPSQGEILLPVRGRPLRDRYVLRLIALDRFVHVVVLTALAIALLVISGNETTLHSRFNRIVAALQSGGGAPVSRRGLLGTLTKVFDVTPTHLREAAAALIAYAVLEATEMVGLWFARRWAEYLTFVATSLLVPFEVYELTSSASVLKVVTLVLNLAVVVYLLVAKRLFGVRGGGRAEREVRERDMGWQALLRESPGSPAAG